MTFASDSTMIAVSAPHSEEIVSASAFCSDSPAAIRADKEAAATAQDQQVDDNKA